MTGCGGIARRLLLGISPDETSFDRRGFTAVDPGARLRLEQVGRTFLDGYHHALADPRPAALAARLETIPDERRGWGYEGATMALALLDIATPWSRTRTDRFIDGPGHAHAYMAHVGMGWALARMRRGVDRTLARCDPLLGWLVVDGYGFHEAYFHWPRVVDEHLRPARLTGYARRVFDQGVGRSLWFIKGADVDAIGACIGGFDVDRHGDLWSGVGLACAYAGGVASESIEHLTAAAAAHRPALAQGAAFAAKARQRAGNPADHTELACRILCDRSPEEAAAVTDDAIPDRTSAGDAGIPLYERWRRGIQARFAAVEVVA